MLLAQKLPSLTPVGKQPTACGKFCSKRDFWGKTQETQNTLSAIRWILSEPFPIAFWGNMQEGLYTKLTLTSSSFPSPAHNKGGLFLKKDFLICIDGTMEQEDFSDHIQLKTRGGFVFKDGNFFITYEES